MFSESSLHFQQDVSVCFADFGKVFVTARKMSQGSLLSPMLFYIYAEVMIQKAFVLASDLGMLAWAVLTWA